MSETNDTTTRPAHSAKTLSLKKTETSTVKQSFSHGRTKAVVVEKKRARVLPGTKATEQGERPKGTLPDAPAPQFVAEAQTTARDAQPRAGVVLRQLTDEEKDARSRALADARVMEAEARKRADEDARQRATDEARLARERVAAERRKIEEDARKAAEEAARRHAEEEASRRLERRDDGTVKTESVPEVARRARPVAEEEDEQA